MYICVCVDRELDGSGVMVWRPGSHNKAGEFTQRTKGGGRGLTDIKPGEQIGTASDEKEEVDR